MSLPLSGVRVLAVEQYGAGPFGTLHLADLGAEIIKIENPRDGGDVGRHVGPHFFSPGDSHFFQTFNRNKKSLTLDLKHPEGLRIFHDLARTADAVLDNLRGDLPEKLGLTYERLKHLHPALVCVHLSAYGRDNSRAAWPGYDYLMQAEAGHLSLTGEPDGPPTRYGISIVDFMTGLTAAYALVSGIVGARASGMGRDLDVSLFDVALHNLSYLATWYLNGGVMQGREPRGAHPSLTPSQLFRTRDGWIFIMCNKEKFWPVLAERMGHPEWAEDPDFRDFKARLAHRERLTEMLDAVLQQRSTDEWLGHFTGQVPAAPVYDVAQALDNPFVAEAGRVIPFHRPDGAPVRLVGNPVRCPGVPLPSRAAPAMGADTEALLKSLGYDDPRILALKHQGVI